MKMFSAIAASMLLRASAFTVAPTVSRSMTRMFSEAQTRVTGKVKFFSDKVCI